MKKITLFTFALLCSTAFVKAQEAELDTVRLYTTLPKTEGLPNCDSYNPWTYIDQENAIKYSGTWVAMWLGLRMPMLSTHLHCTPLKKTDPNFGVYENCDASIDFGSDKKAKTISYVGKWKGCQGTETYTFYKHTPHEVLAWLTQEDTWLLEIRRPKIKTTKRQQQQLLSNEEHPTYLFDFQLNKKGEIIYLSATYGSEGFSISYTIKKGAKKTTILEIVSDCSQAVEE
jgi:hypothetical protein